MEVNISINDLINKYNKPLIMSTNKCDQINQLISNRINYTNRLKKYMYESIKSI